jgi:hypothetical protein
MREMYSDFRLKTRACNNQDGLPAVATREKNKRKIECGIVLTTTTKIRESVVNFGVKFWLK